MGAYLSEPITEKESFDESHSHVEWGVSSMQGWRMAMEDAVCCHADVDSNKSSLFGVFDGHGGREVAEYCAQNLHKFILDTDEYSEGDIKSALRKAFLAIDKAILSEEVIELLKTMSANADDDDTDTEEDEAALLLEEANMPISQLLERFKGNIKQKLKDNGILLGSTAGEDDGQAGEANKDKENINGHTEIPDEIKLPASSKKSRKQKQPVKREEKPKSNGDSTSNHIQEEEPSSSSCTSSTDQVNVKEEPSSSSDLSENKNNSGDDQPSSSGQSSNKNHTLEEPSSLTVSTVDKDSSSEEPSSAVSIENASTKKEDEDITQDNENEDDENDDEEEDDDDEEDDDEDDYDDEDDDDDEEFEAGEDIDFSQGTEEIGKESGTTAVIALMIKNKLYVANAGDSRCVLCRNGNAIEMSKDHKPEDEIEKNRIEKAGGKITADGRVNGGLNLSRAIGDHVYKNNEDLPAEEQIITALPDIKEIELTKDDSFIVLACDGIWNVMTNEEVIDFIQIKLNNSEEKVSLSKICEELFDNCLAPDTENDGTGCDNMTCIIVRLKDGEETDSSTGTSKKRKRSDNGLTFSKKSKATVNDLD